MCAVCKAVAVAAAVAAATAAADAGTRDLGSAEWRLRNANGSIWLEGVTVPGDVHLALTRAGRIGEVYRAANDLASRWVSSDNWTFSTQFGWPGPAPVHCWLVCDGLDTVAVARLNGRLVGAANNQFRRHQWLLPAGLLRAGGNLLEIEFQGPVPYAARRAAAYPYSVGAASFPSGLPHPNFIRKRPSDFGWDWGPAIAPVGVWRPVGLAWSGRGRRLDQLWADMSLDSALSPVNSTGWPAVYRIGEASTFLVRVGASVSCAVAGRGTLRFRLANRTATVGVECAGPAQEVVGTATLRVPASAVRLWWPVGYGAQPLYRLSACLDDQDTLERSIGFRVAALDRSSLPANESGASMILRVNGIPIFARGASIVPFDALDSRLSNAQLEAQIEAAAAANMNVLRIWGGGDYGRAALWEACDRLGLLVWLDLQFASALYPRDDEFVENVAREVTDQARRLTGHPSLVLWCGSNEAVIDTYRQSRANVPGGVDIGKLRLFTADLAVLFDQAARQALWQVNPVVSFFASSPSNDAIVDRPADGMYIHRWLDDAFDPRWGDVRHYDYNSECTLTSLYPRGRFVSEFGWQSYPSLYTLSQVTSPSDWDNNSTMMNHRQRHPNGNIELSRQISRFFPLPKSGNKTSVFERFIYLSQVVQSLCIGTQARYYRTLKQTPGAYTYGALYWQLNDVWQAQSWSSLEYGGRWKLLHYVAKEAFEPVSVSIFAGVEEGPANLVNITHVNDLAEDVTAELEVEVWEWQTSKLVFRNQTSVSIPAFSSDVLWSGAIGHITNGRTRADVAIRCTLRSVGGQQPSSVLLPRSFIGVPLKDPMLSVESFEACSDGCVCFSLKAQELSAFVWMSTHIPGVFSENGLLLPPNETHEIMFTPANASEDHLRARLKASLVTQSAYH